jgi:hypothetical protein
MTVTADDIVKKLDEHADAMREGFAQIHKKLDVLERQLGLIPNLNFLDRHPVAREVVQALRRDELNLPQQERMLVPPGAPGRPRTGG